MAATARVAGPGLPWALQSPPSSLLRQFLNLSPPYPQRRFRRFLPLRQPSLLRRSISPLPKRGKDCVSVACLPSPAPSTANTKLYVSGLSFRTTEESLRNAFQNFGRLVEVNLIMDRIANRPRGFAFLRYATEDEANAAIEGMHGKFLDGRVIFVEVSKPRTDPRRSTKLQTSRRF